MKRRVIKKAIEELEKAFEYYKSHDFFIDGKRINVMALSDDHFIVTDRTDPSKKPMAVLEGNAIEVTDYIFKLQTGRS